ncbi:transcription factor with AP2 domain(s) [Plasmodium vinckei vinckei]|uniref:Transcription factor with AP2 domain(S) n=1 Tax=Plasmodium vinckei vinckei TaxID=54757 RepID=A0A449BZW1_PLAVN|nr:transcription factor with AP2 domain(s) [Plasmodium vinckei vinckei]KEG04267.1 hypothetical protein YYE_01173 [Plasmodium vinckei vinckei]VEV58932.1 transcription factor with AP2 domain(s) [Plasmodium vinckei vinckei]
MNKRGSYSQISEEVKCIENEHIDCTLNNEQSNNYNNSQINSYNNNYTGVQEGNELTNSNLCLNSNIPQHNYYNNKIKDTDRFYKNRIFLDHKNNMNNSEINEYNCDSEKYRDKMYSNSTISIGNYRNYINKDNCDYNINMYNNTKKFSNTNSNCASNSKKHKAYTECDNKNMAGENSYTKYLTTIINNGSIVDPTKNNFPANSNTSANFNDQCNDIKNKNNTSNNFQQYNNSIVYGQNMSNKDVINNNQYYEYVNHNYNMGPQSGIINCLDTGMVKNSHSNNSNIIKENYLMRNSMIHSMEAPIYNTNDPGNSNYEQNSFNNLNYTNYTGEYNNNYRNDYRNPNGWNYNAYYNNNCNNPIGEDSNSNLVNNSDNICSNTVSNSNNNNTVNMMIGNNNGTIMNNNTGDNNIDHINTNMRNTSIVSNGNSDTAHYKYNIKNNNDHMILATDNEKARFDPNNNIYMNNNYINVDQCYANDGISRKNTSRCTNTNINIDSSNPTMTTSSIYDDNTLGNSNFSNKNIVNSNYMFNVTAQNCDMINSNITTKYDTSFLSNFEQDDNECNTENDLDIDTVSDDYYNKTNYRYENINQRNSSNNAFDVRDAVGSIPNMANINDPDLFNQYSNIGLNGMVNKFPGNTNINRQITNTNSNGTNKRYSNSTPKNNEMAILSDPNVGSYKQYPENKNFMYSDTNMCNNIENSRNTQDYDNKLNGINPQGVEIPDIRKDSDNKNAKNGKYKKHQKNGKLNNNSSNSYVPSKSSNPSNYVLDNYNLNESCNLPGNNGNIASLANMNSSTDKISNYNYNNMHSINMKDANINMGHLEKYSINVVNNILIANPKDCKNSAQIENIENTQLLYNDENNSDAISGTRCSSTNNGTNYRKMNNNMMYDHNTNVGTKEGAYNICKNLNKNSVSGSIYNQLYDKMPESNNLQNYNIKNESIDNIAFLLNLNNQKNNRLGNNSKNYNNMNVLANDEHDTQYINSMNNMKNISTRYYSNTNKNISSENAYDYLTNQPYNGNIFIPSGSNNNIYNGYGNKNNDYTQWIANSRHMSSNENKSSINMGHGYNPNGYLIDNNNILHSNDKNANKSIPALCDNNMYNNYMPLKNYYENHCNGQNNNIGNNPNACNAISNDIDTDIANDVNNLNMLITPKIKGVRFDKSGRRWVASWSQNGNQKRQYFPIKKFGKAQAKYLAIYARIKAVKCMQKKSNKNPENKRSYSKKLTNKEKTKQVKDESQNIEHFNDAGEDYLDKFPPDENNLCQNGSESSANKTDELYNDSEDDDYTKNLSKYMTEENYKSLANGTPNTTEFNNYMNDQNKTENNLHNLSKDANQNDNPTINTNIENADDNTDSNCSSGEADDKQSCSEEKTNINNYNQETEHTQMQQYTHNINNNINNHNDNYNFNMNGNTLSEEKKDNQNNTTQLGEYPNVSSNNNDTTSNHFVNNTTNLKNDNENIEPCENSEENNPNNEQTEKGETLLQQINGEINSNEESNNTTIKNDENALEKNDNEFYDPNEITNNVNENNINEKLKNMILLIERFNGKNIKIIKNPNEKVNIQFIENEANINNIDQINILDFNDKLILLNMLKEYYMKNNTSNYLSSNKGGNTLDNINQTFEPNENRNTNVNNVDTSNQDHDNNNLLSEKSEKEVSIKSKKHTAERINDNHYDVNIKKAKTCYDEDISNVMIPSAGQNDTLNDMEKTNHITKSDGSNNNDSLNGEQLHKNEEANEINTNNKNTNDSNETDNGSTKTGLFARVKNGFFKKLNNAISNKSNNQVESKEDPIKNITEKEENTAIFKTNDQNLDNEQQQNDSHNMSSLDVKNDQENTTPANDDKNEICDSDDLSKDIDSNIPNNIPSDQSNYFFKSYYTYENSNNVNNIGINSNNNYKYNYNNCGNYQVDGNANNNYEENDGEDTNENNKNTKKIESLSSYPNTVINGLCDKMPEIQNGTPKELQFHDYTKQIPFNNNSYDFSITPENADANSKKFIPYNIGNKTTLTTASISTTHEPTDASTIASPQRITPNDHLICELNHEQNMNDSKFDTNYSEGNKTNFIRNVLQMNIGNNNLMNDSNELENDLNDDAINETDETTNIDEINNSRDYCNDLDKNQIDHSQYNQYAEHADNNKGHMIHTFPQYSFGTHYDSSNNLSNIISTNERGHNNGYPIIVDTKNGLPNINNMDNINGMSTNLSSNENTANYVNINNEYTNAHISELTEIDRNRINNTPYLLRNEYDNFYSKNDLYYDPNYSALNQRSDSNNSSVTTQGNNILLQNGFNPDMNMPYVNLTNFPSSDIVNEQMCMDDQKNNLSFLNPQLFNYKHNMDIMQNQMSPNNDHENVQHSGDNNTTLYNSRNNNTNNISDNAYNIPTNNTTFISQMEI